MGQEEDLPDRTTRLGLWCPLKQLGTNVVVPAQHNSNLYYFDGQSVTSFNLANLLTLLGNGSVVEYKTVSLYFCRTALRFWVVNFDATTQAVGAEEEDDDSEDSDDEQMEDPGNPPNTNEPNLNLENDWAPLSFTWPRIPGRNRHTGQSTLNTVHAGHAQLYATRSDQTWPSRLLPLNYQPLTLDRSNMTERQPPFGSLNGNLPLMIALVAFTASPNGSMVHDALLRCIQQGGWHHPAERGTGCKLDPCSRPLLVVCL